MMVSVMLVVVFHNASRYLIYTVFSQSVGVQNIYDLVVAHDCRLLGALVFPYAICTHQIHQSVGHVIFNVTHEVVVHISSLFITKLHHVGALAS